MTIQTFIEYAEDKRDAATDPDTKRAWNCMTEDAVKHSSVSEFSTHLNNKRDSVPSENRHFVYPVFDEVAECVNN